MPPRRLISSAKAAGILGVDARTLVRWARTGHITFYKTLGGHYRFDPADVYRFRDNDMRLADPDPAGPAPSPAPS
jgi:excisionase family DNA binding protein